METRRIEKKIQTRYVKGGSTWNARVCVCVRMLALKNTTMQPSLLLLHVVTAMHLFHSIIEGICYGAHHYRNCFGFSLLRLLPIPRTS